MEIDFDAITSEVNEEVLMKAILNNEFELFYQPQVDVCTDRLFGSEALVRWKQKATGQIIPPAKFIPLAEETGLIIPLGEEIIRMACFQNKMWQKQGYRPTPVSVNLSPVQLQQANMIRVIKDILDEVDLDPKYLILEITENISLNNSKDMINKLEKIKELGVRIAVDDFGTGYSSLSYLHKVPIDFLKIDREFTMDLVKDIRCQAIIHSIINMAKSLDIITIAEGIENELQAKYLTSLGCQIMQGFHFSKPISSDGFSNFLNNRYCEKYAYTE